MRKNINILILDDEPIVCDLLASNLLKKGYEVEMFTDSKAAIDRLGEKRFQILITDLKMSGPKGIDVIHFAKERIPGIKVIVISGYATKEMANSALAAGALRFIPKPFKIREINKLVADIEAELDDTS